MVRLRETEVILRLCIVFFSSPYFIFGRFGFSDQRDCNYPQESHCHRFVCSGMVWLLHNMVQLGFVWYVVTEKTSNSKWLSYIFDQTALYVVFAGTSAAAQHSLLVMTGSRELQWMKWCSKFTRFCFQIGSAIILNYTAVAFMLILSSLSAFNLFRLYSPKRYFHLKSSS